MSNKKQYDNKFHKFQFKTDSEKDMKLNNPSISKDMDSLNISDDFSNGLGVNYAYSGEGKDIDIEK